jgi:hypothetical protein
MVRFDHLHGKKYLRLPASHASNPLDLSMRRRGLCAVLTIGCAHREIRNKTSFGFMAQLLLNTTTSLNRGEIWILGVFLDNVKKLCFP